MRQLYGYSFTFICAWLFLCGLFGNKPPTYDRLQVVTGILSNQPLISKPLKGDRTGWISLADKHFQIDSLCFLPTHCELPDDVINLKAGDSVTIWVSPTNFILDTNSVSLSNGRIWQLQKDDTILLSYQELVRANRAQSQRFRVLGVGVGLILLIITRHLIRFL